MLNRLLYRLTAKLPCRLIELDSGPYLERYYLGQMFGVTFYLHRFVSSDSEEHLHNHPWRYGAALILSGGYTEERAFDICPHVAGSGCLTQKVRRGWYNRVDGNTIHRIMDALPGTWTLFVHGPRATVDVEVAGAIRKLTKGWGFFERKYIVGLHEVTVFRPAPSGNHAWWETALPGAESNRVKL